MKIANKTIRQARTPASGFTLVELLVAISIIVIILGLGVLAFNSLTGRRSTAMARNQIAAMLAKARSIAINDTSTQSVSYGVIFFRDPETERTAMAIARRDDTGGGDPDPHDNYKAWNLNVRYQPGDRVVAIVRDDVEGAITAVRFRCSVANVGSQATRPPAYRPVNTYPPLRNQYWEEVLEGSITYPDEPLEFLPVGVGVQVMTDPGTIIDRYTRIGGIFFDRRGQLDHLSFQIGQGSPVGLRLGLTHNIPINTSNPLYTGVGLAIYDEQSFIAAGHSQEDHDDRVRDHNLPRPSLSDENAEEEWIDDNANLLTVNRYSGELNEIR